MIQAGAAVIVHTGWDVMGRTPPVTSAIQDLRVPGLARPSPPSCSSNVASPGSGSTRSASTPVSQPLPRCTTSPCPPGCGTSKG